MLKNSWILFTFIILVMLVSGCSNDKKTSDSDSDIIVVYTDIPPLTGFVQQIGGELVRVNSLIKPGDNPHTYEPTPRQVSELSKADIFFVSGLPFSNAISNRVKKSSSDVEIVYVDKGIEKRHFSPFSAEEEDDHSHHDHGHSHHESNKDPHIWLAPELIKKQAQHIVSKLETVDPLNATIYRVNFDQFISEIDAKDQIMREKLEPYRGKSFFVFHPAFGYFAESYGLVEKPLEFEGKSPSPKQIEQLIETAKRENAQVLFVQPQFDKSSAEAIASAIGGEVAPLDPLDKDVLPNLMKIADVLKSAFGGE